MSSARVVPILGWGVLISLASACSHMDKPKTTSESAGGSTPVTVATETGSTGTASAVPVTYESAESAFRSSNYKEAAKLFSSYTESNPENAWGFYMLGLSDWRSGEPSRALEAFDRALALDPSHHKSLFNSSRVLLEAGRPGEALQRIEQALTAEPSSNEAFRLLGRAKYQLGGIDEAIEAYHRALAIDDQDVWSMNNLGVIYIEQGRSSEALPALARAVEIRSNSPVFQNNLGTALERSGHPMAAAKAYEAALGVDSTYQKASISLARVTGQREEPETELLDLGALSAKFQAEIETWRGSLPAADSSETRDSTLTPDSMPVPDSSGSQIVGLSDSSRASVEAVPDTLEDCAQEDR